MSAVPGPQAARETVGHLLRWDPAVDSRGQDALEFVEALWGHDARRALLVAGAGFDPRASRLPELLAEMMGDRLAIVLIREERPEPDAALVARATENARRLARLAPAAVVQQINVLARDNAVIGGREAATIASQLAVEDVDDVIVDFSALSIGTSFPLTAVLIQRAQQAGGNLHAMVVADALLDEAIRPVPSEGAIEVHGFRGGWRLDETAGAARLWLPQLAHGRRAVLDRIFREVAPHDICPILPFPAGNPRRGDLLIEEFLSEFESTWEVDARSIIYAAEDNPLDVYRTILQLDDARKGVFESHGGSICILSPVGSKVLALGALMAAMERHFPVLYVEAIGYEIDADIVDGFPLDGGELAHVWLAGNP